MLATAETADEICLRAHLAFQVVRQEVFVPEGGGGGVDRKIITFPAEPEWVRPEDLAVRYNSWYAALKKWTPNCSELPGHVVVAEPATVRNLVPLMDERCPTAAVAWALREQGWRGIEQKCDHVTTEIAFFDSTAAVKMKAYYQALYKLPRCLALTSHMPSRQPIRFYRLLLAGIRAEPGCDAKEYKAICDREEERCGKPMGALLDGEVEDPFVPIGDGPGSDDSDIAVQITPAAPKPKRRKIAGAPRDGGGGGGGRAAPPPPGPKAPPPIPPPGPPSPSDSDVSVRLPSPTGSGGGDGGGTANVDSDIEVGFDGVVVPPKRHRDDRPDWTDSIRGFLVRYDPDYVPPGGSKPVPNWRIKCKIVAHGKRCEKRRGETAAFTRQYGEVEPLIWLHAWAEHTEPAAGKSHGLTNPTQQSVDRVAEASLEELKAVLRRIKD